MIMLTQSEIEAINDILSAVGSSPVNTVEDTDNVDIINAKHILYKVSREVQTRGWAFNTEENVTLSPSNEAYEIPYPDNFLVVKSKGFQLIKRNGVFFDVLSRTSEFPAGLIITVIRELNFEELPTCFRNYIVARSARLFQERYLTDNELSAVLKMEEDEAYSYMVDYDLEVGDYNIFRGDTFISQNINR